MLRSLIIVLLLIFVGGSYLILKPKRRSHRTEAASSADEKESGPTGEASAASNLMPTKSTVMAGSNKATSQVAQRVKLKHFTDDPKVHLNIAKLLAKSADFRDLNPGLTVEKFESGDFDPSSIKLPRGLKLSYEYDPACRDSRNAVANPNELSNRERKNLSLGGPAFLSREIPVDIATVGNLSTRVSTDSCIRGLSFDASNSTDHKAEPGSPDLLASQSEQKQAADRAIADAASADGKVKMAVIGLGEDLYAEEPSLMARQAKDGHFKQISSDYAMPGQGSDGGLSTVPVKLRPFVIQPSAAGGFSDSQVSNEIIHATNKGYKVINIKTPGFDSADFEAALAYARSHGASVVNNVPVPPARPRQPASH